MAICLRCGNDWEPRKARPKKCPSCQNPNWDKPKKKRRGGSSSVVERPSAKVSDEQSPDKAEGGSSVRIPASPHQQIVETDSLSSAKARAESLLRQLA